ncbi:unnamed protein product, partial [marine sediment metagenome]
MCVRRRKREEKKEQEEEEKEEQVLGSFILAFVPLPLPPYS